MRFTVWLVLVATLLLWSGNWIVARAVRDEISPALATVGRLVVVLAILLPFAGRALWHKLPLLKMKDWWILAGLGFTGGGPHLTLQWLGLHYTTAASGILYLSTTPIFIALMALPLGERLSPRQMLGVAISFTGVVIIGTHGDLAHFTFNVGDLMAVASMAMWAGYTVLLRLRRDPLEIIELLCVVCLFGIVFMTPWLVGEFFSGVKLNLTGAGALAVLYSAICSLLLAYAGWSYVVTRLGAARAGVTLHLMPAFGVILSSIFLGEYPHWFHFVGMAAILAGVFTASSASNSR